MRDFRHNLANCKFLLCLQGSAGLSAFWGVISVTVVLEIRILLRLETVLA